MAKTVRVLTAIAVLVWTVLCLPASAAEGPEKAAQAAGEAWLTIVDADNYAESWKQASSFFKQQVSVQQWESAMRSVRAQTGRLATRKFKSAQYTKTLPGAPDGEYVVIQYDSAFEKAKSVTETLTPMKDKDGTWRVAGYFVK